MRTIYWRDIVQPGEAFHLARRQMRGRHPCDLHKHDFAEIFWLEQGTGVQVVNGVRQKLEAGDLQFIRPDDGHEYFGDLNNGAPVPYMLVNLAFAWETVEFLRTRYFPEDLRFFGGAEPLPAQFRLTPAQIHHWHQAVLELSTAPRRPMTIERFLLNLFHDLGQTQMNPQLAAVSGMPGTGLPLVLTPTPADTTSDGSLLVRPGAACPAWLRSACEAIRERTQFLGGTRRFAELAGRTPEHVAREVRRCFGTTPTEIVNRARLSAAAADLALSSEAILDIALRCGFNSLAHFYGQFRHLYGMSPRQYRLKSQAVVR